jgi:thiol-disulfide isomerase/thioredoxin
LVAEDSLAGPVPALAGQPTLMFLWAEWCADCKAQAASLSRIRRRFEPEGLRLVAVTRYYDPEPQRAREKARVDSVWKAVYSDVGNIPIVLSTESMETYGGSSTPTYVFVDKSGTVKHYIPTRLTEAEFDKRIKAIID